MKSIKINQDEIKRRINPPTKWSAYQRQQKMILSTPKYVKNILWGKKNMKKKTFDDPPLEGRMEAIDHR